MAHKQIFIVAGYCITFLVFSALLFFTTRNFDAHQEIDSPEYEEVAHHYLETGKFAHPRNGMPAHTIAYYWFLGTIYSWFGNNQLYVFLIQILLSLICILLIYHSTYYLFGANTASIAAVLASCNIGFIVYSQLIMAEILLLIFLISFLYALSCFVYEQKWYYLAAAGLFLSISVLVKPVALFFALLMPFFIWFAQMGALRLKIARCCLFLLCFYTPLLGYMTYNYKNFNAFAVTTIPAVNVYDYFLPRRIIPQLKPEVAKKVSAYIDSSKDYAEHTQRSKEVLMQLIGQHPLVFVYAIAQSMTKILFGLYSTQLKMMYNTAIRGGGCSYFLVTGTTIFERLANYAFCGAQHWPLKIIAVTEMLLLFIQYFLLLCALVFLLYERHYFWILFWVAYVGYFTFAACFDGCGRYRMMLEPVFIMLIAFAVMRLFTLFTNKTKSECSLRVGVSS